MHNIFSNFNRMFADVSRPEPQPQPEPITLTLVGATPDELRELQAVLPRIPGLTIEAEPIAPADSTDARAHGQAYDAIMDLCFAEARENGEPKDADGLPALDHRQYATLTREFDDAVDYVDLDAEKIFVHLKAGPEADVMRSVGAYFIEQMAAILREHLLDAYEGERERRADEAADQQRQANYWNRP